MRQLYTFHHTVTGHLHILNDLPCEDASGSFSSEEGRYYIAAVADGHGSRSCFRSQYGAKAAVEVALECLQQFAKTVLESDERFYKNIFSDPRYRKCSIRQLTDTMIASWHDRVSSDYNSNPPTEEELKECAGEFEIASNPAHIYGTTLLAALQTSKCLILLHQGDGRCNVFYADGTVDQPVPWDSRCESFVTTSLCDGDAADSFRNCIINLEEKPVMACYLGCDGVEDAYRDTYEGLGGSHVLMGGVYTFYKELTSQIVRGGQEKFEADLELILSQFSTCGSGDDVSVAGIVDLDIIQKFIQKYEYDVKYYRLEEELFWKENELRSKVRKHTLLQNRKEEIQEKLKAEQKTLSDLERKLYQLETVYRNQGQGTGFCGWPFQNNSFNQKTENLEQQIRQDYRTGTERLGKLESKLAKAQVEFEEYDRKYREIEHVRKELEKELAELRKNQGYCIASDVSHNDSGEI